jgi:hypothetical protein
MVQYANFNASSKSKKVHHSVKIQDRAISSHLQIVGMMVKVCNVSKPYVTGICNAVVANFHINFNLKMGVKMLDRA